MKYAFLFGDVAENFEANSVPFVQASRGIYCSASIALLLMGGSNWEKYVPRYRDPWLRLGASEVVPIVPLPGSTELSAEAVSSLRRCSGVFIAGGDTRIYHRIYAAPQVRQVIRGLYEAGIPFGGVSAGALISTESCIVWGSRVTAPTSIWSGQSRILTRPKMEM